MHAQAIHELVVLGGFTNVVHVVRPVLRVRGFALIIQHVCADVPLLPHALQDGGYSAYKARKLPGDWDE